MTDSKITLNAEVRTIFGKKTRKMRKEGLLPANIFGQDFESQSITLKLVEFVTVFKKAGETDVIYVEVDGKSVPTLLSDIQYHPQDGNLLHVDFRKVNLKKKIEAHVPVVMMGESEAVAQKNGVLITPLDYVVVEALPTDIPHQIEIDLSKLKEIGDQISVGDLPASEKYTITNPAETIVVSVTEHKEESIEPETVSEAPEITTEVKAEGEEAGTGETAGTPAQDEDKKEDK
jgi:large subunit ribosomal protein L25